MLLFMGSQSRRCPARSAVNPSRARRTYDARTVPCRVTARDGSTRVTSVPS